MNDPVDPNAQSQMGQDDGQANQNTNPQADNSQASGAAPMSDQGTQAQSGMGGSQPPMGTPTGAQPPAGTPPAGGGLSGIMDEDVDVSNLVANAGQNQQDSAALLQMPIPAHPNTTFDEKKFVELLAGSISLTVNEKRKIIEAIPQLSQFQIDELIKIFEEEKGKFAELEQKHADQIAELEKQHAGSMHDVQAQQEEAAKKSTEEEEAERIKRELGL